MTIIDIGDALAGKLGPQWRHAPPPMPAWGTLLKRTDGLWLHITAAPERINTRACWEGDDPYSYLPRRHIHHWNPSTPSITCALQRGIPAIARDIRRRLLPDAEVWFANMEHDRTEWANHKQAIDSVCAQFQVFPDITYTPTDPDFNQRLKGPGFTVEVYQEHTVRITFGALSPDTAIKLLTAYYQLKGTTS